MIKYEDSKRNHVIIPGREKELEKFLNSTYKGINHKLKNSFSSNSEDAITWSCFDIISQLKTSEKINALNEIIEHSFIKNSNTDKVPFTFENENEIIIEIGKTYYGNSINEETEVDASIETAGKVIFFEAKLYSSVSLQDKNKPYDQIAKKLRVGLDYSSKLKKEYFFVFLDIAPRDKLYEFSDEKKSKENAMKHPSKKWKSVWWFNRYKNGWNGSLKPLRLALTGIDTTNQSVENVSKNMGWLTWTDLFKITMRGIIKNNFA